MPAKTRIADVTTHLVDRHCFVRVHTEDGVVGTGQSAYFGFPHVTVPVLDALKTQLIGQDPDDIGRLWLEMYRSVPVRGGAFTSSIAAVDIALWDLKGRRYEVPAYELLGGRHRTRVRTHILLGMRTWPRSSTREELIRESREAVDEGFTALKFDPLLEDENGFHTQTLAGKINAAAALVRDIRAEVGPDIDLALEIHRKLDVGEAIAFADAVRDQNIYMFEDALPPDSVSEWARLSAQARIPLGYGERQDTIYEFADALQAGIDGYFRPDVGTAGGLSHCVKIAALAESRHRRIIAHNFMTPFLTAATLQLYAAVPNVGTFEWNPLDELAPRDQMLEAPVERDGGWLMIPEGPGLGVDLSEAYLDGTPFDAPAPPGTMRTPDGSVYAR